MGFLNKIKIKILLNKLVKISNKLEIKHDDKVSRFTDKICMELYMTPSKNWKSKKVLKELYDSYKKCWEETKKEFENEIQKHGFYVDDWGCVDDSMVVGHDDVDEVFIYYEGFFPKDIIDIEVE